MQFKASISEYTEKEFLEILNKLFNGQCSTEQEYHDLLEHVEQISQHPKGNEILFYPAPGVEDSPEGVLRTIKEWRKANGLPGFKKTSILDDCTIDTWAIPESAPGKIHLIITDHFKWGNENEAQHLKLLQEKINTYLAFIKSGELTSAIPSSEGKTPVIFVEGKYPLSEQALKLFSAVDQVLKGTGIEVVFESR